MNGLVQATGREAPALRRMSLDLEAVKRTEGGGRSGGRDKKRKNMNLSKLQGFAPGGEERKELCQKAFQEWCVLSR